MFQDRLVNVEDREWLERTVSTKMRQYFSLSPANIGSELRDLIFATCFDSADKYVIAPASMVPIRQLLETHLESYNKTHKNQLSLVLFDAAIHHLLRICRCVQMNRGHALLVGYGGSGRKSLARLSFYMCGVQTMTIDEEWRDSIKHVLTFSSRSVQNVGLLISDSDISDQAMEDINSLLNAGAVPGLFTEDEIADFGPYEDFVDRCRRRLRIVLCFSPTNLSWLRSFPSIINCCYIDWFDEWSELALQAVGRRVLNINDSVITAFVAMHKESSSRKQKHDYYVTPSTYIVLLNTFKKLLHSKRDTLTTIRTKFEVGLQHLLDTEKNVSKMQEELKALEPVLNQATIDTDLMMQKIVKQQQDADARKAIVSREEKLCNEQRENAEKMKMECEADLATALPVLENAIKALQTLKKSQISEIKSMKKPPHAVRQTMEAICMLLQVPPKKIQGNRGKVTYDYWKASLKLVSDFHFLKRLLNYDKDNIPLEVIEKVKPYASMGSLKPDIVKKASVAAGGLCKWMHAIVKYDEVYRFVKPKKDKLDEATEALENAEKALKEKHNQLEMVLKLLDNLMVKFKETNAEKDQLAKQVFDCKTKLARATKLISGLADEKVRWAEEIGNLKEKEESVLGDIVLSSGIVAYMGMSDSESRRRLTKKWKKLCSDCSIAVHDGYSLQNTLGDDVQIRGWHIAKLPRDDFSISNAIMMDVSDRWPLMIDPQGQAATWIKSMVKGLVVVQVADKKFGQRVDDCSNFGGSILVEGIDMEFLKKDLKAGKGFSLYISTSLVGHKFSPEICVKYNILNFTTTQTALNDQMLSIVVAEEEPEMETQLNKVIIDSAENKKLLKDLQDKILHMLTSSKGNILDDETLINTLSKSKTTSKTIEQRVAAMEKVRNRIGKVREGYKGGAYLASKLYFIVASLTRINAMYEYSLEWFVALYVKSIREKKSFVGKLWKMWNGVCSETISFVCIFAVHIGLQMRWKAYRGSV